MHLARSHSPPRAATAATNVGRPVAAPHELTTPRDADSTADATTGSPAARYSYSFSGQLASLNGPARYGMIPTSAARRWAGSSSWAIGPEDVDVGARRHRRLAAPMSTIDTCGSCAASCSTSSVSTRSFHAPAKTTRGRGSVARSAAGAGADADWRTPRRHTRSG